jgi:mono/diheme cytochrome c family protein
MRNLAVFAVGGALCLSVLWFFTIDNSVAMQGAAQSSAARGKYLLDAGGCDDCHTPKTFTQKGPVPDMSRRFSGTPAVAKLPQVPTGVIGPNDWGALGSNDMTVWAGPWGISFAANLTPDKATGIGNWTEAAFVKAMRTGKHKGALREILPPMPWQSLGKMSDGDLKAMFAYLKTIKPIVNKVPDPIPPKR